MSGGSMNYLYVRVSYAEFDINSPERAAFREHLMLVAKALRSIEWNDSGDGDDQEVHNIMACISLSALENDMLRADNERLRAALRWYADRLNHFPFERRRRGDPDPAVVIVDEPAIMTDCGRRAREALEDKP